MFLKVFEAFAGVGSQRMALRNLGIEHEVVAIAEIDKFAIKSYEAIHGEILNLGDISKINTEDIPDHDLFTYSFPCQDISVAGKGRGLDWLTEHGYSNYWQVLNAKDYGVPQNRERVFVLSILGEHEPYEFPKPVPLELRLKDVLEDEVDEKNYLSQDQIDRITFSGYVQNTRRIQEKDWCDTLCARDYKDPKCVKVNQIGQYNTNTRINSNRFRVYYDLGISPSLTTMGGGNLEPHIPIKNATKKGYIEATDGDGIDLAYLNSESRRGRVQKEVSQTLTTDGSKGVLTDYRIRKLTPLECWRLMGFSDGDFHKAEQVNSNTQLYKQAGNAIVVDVLEGIFSKLMEVI